MRSTWMYYDYLRRFGILVLLGFGIGAFLEFVYYETQPSRTWYIARANIAMPPSLQFRVVSPDFPDAKSAVDYILDLEHALEAVNQENFVSGDFEIEGWYRTVLWQAMAVGGVVGGLVAIGIVYVWDDVLTYQRRRKEGR